MSSWAIAAAEGADVSWPSAWLLVRGLAGGWLIFAAWAALGMLLAVVTRGTALATGIGILYAFVVEGLLSVLAGEISVLDRLVEFFVRANGYSLVSALGVSADEVSDNGPGLVLRPVRRGRPGDARAGGVHGGVRPCRSVAPPAPRRGRKTATNQ